MASMWVIAAGWDLFGTLTARLVLARRDQSLGETRMEKCIATGQQVAEKARGMRSKFGCLRNREEVARH